TLPRHNGDARGSHEDVPTWLWHLAHRSLFRVYREPLDLVWFPLSVAIRCAMSRHLESFVPEADHSPFADASDWPTSMIRRGRYTNAAERFSLPHSEQYVLFGLSYLLA